MDSSENINTKSSIRLSTLNSQVREKLTKFDTANDGELSIEEAIQGLVTLQKQSNNYKKIVYLLLPLLIIMICCILGVNILAIKLTKDLTSSSSAGNPVLTNTQGNVLSTVSYSSEFNLLNWLNNYDIAPIQKITIDNLSVNVDSYFLDSQSNVTRLYINTQMIHFYIGSDAVYDIDYNYGYKSNLFAQKIFLILTNELQSIQSFIINSKLVIDNEKIYNKANPTKINVIFNKQPTHIPDVRGFGCSPISTVCI